MIIGVLLLSAASCGYSKKFTTMYYQENESLLQSARLRFAELYRQRPFSLELKDRELTRLGLELHTDTIRYIYNFRLDEPYLLDTLDKYNLDVKSMSQLINDLQKAHVTWISLLDYYENKERKNLLFMSVRHKKLEAFLKPEKYFTLAFFRSEQPIDKKGRLLDKEDGKTLRRINGEVFRSINGHVFYALMESYR